MHMSIIMLLSGVIWTALGTPLVLPMSSFTAEGTSNLVKTKNACLEVRGLSVESKAPVTLPYSEASHRALIALRAAKYNHPFNAVLDDDYQEEVRMLRPGTALPSPSTVSRDINAIYIAMGDFIRSYFMVCSFIIT
ncbi:hypothetical protein BDZ94DRAFT_1221376 [Collybia nuda]|uniref:Uncharacterized protein n=1 Tax=Collybia nuda TaxID=64659 RepID=A0A9P5Y0X5_9AGAR|nr:hypothetical protein BDZ94DRAFT_1221376 [Collybia nuda]